MELYLIETKIDGETEDRTVETHLQNAQEEAVQAANAFRTLMMANGDADVRGALNAISPYSPVEWETYWRSLQRAFIVAQPPKDIFTRFDIPEDDFSTATLSDYITDSGLDEVSGYSIEITRLDAAPKDQPIDRTLYMVRATHPTVPSERQHATFDIAEANQTAARYLSEIWQDVLDAAFEGDGGDEIMGSNFDEFEWNDRLIDVQAFHYAREHGIDEAEAKADLLKFGSDEASKHAGLDVWIEKHEVRDMGPAPAPAASISVFYGAIESDGELIPIRAFSEEGIERAAVEACGGNADKFFEWRKDREPTEFDHGDVMEFVMADGDDIEGAPGVDCSGYRYERVDLPIGEGDAILQRFVADFEFEMADDTGEGDLISAMSPLVDQARDYLAGKPVKSQPTPVEIAVILEGGLVQNCTMRGDADVTVTVVDYDTDGADDDELSLVEQDDGEMIDAFVREASVDQAGTDGFWISIIKGRAENGNCGQCEGTGRCQSMSNLEDEECPVCDGTGEIEEDEDEDTDVSDLDLGDHAESSDLKPEEGYVLIDGYDGAGESAKLTTVLDTIPNKVLQDVMCANAQDISGAIIRGLPDEPQEIWATTDRNPSSGQASFCLVYRAPAAPKAYLYDSDSCPSKHHNDGNDICADCGEFLNWAHDLDGPGVGCAGIIAEALEAFGYDVEVFDKASGGAFKTSDGREFTFTIDQTAKGDEA